MLELFLQNYFTQEPTFKKLYFVLLTGIWFELIIQVLLRKEEIISEIGSEKKKLF